MFEEIHAMNELVFLLYCALPGGAPASHNGDENRILFSVKMGI